MRYILLLIISIYLIKPAYNQEVNIKGLVIVFFTEKIPSFGKDTDKFYCLDSIRLYSSRKVFPLYGDDVQNEIFLYKPISNIHYHPQAIRFTELYCLNKLDNYLHQGGALFEKTDNPNNIYIAFNIKGVGFYIRPDINSIITDSLFERLDKQAILFYDDYHTETCPKYINKKEYIILSEDFKSAPITKKQKYRLRFHGSNITKFLRYGLW